MSIENLRERFGQFRILVIGRANAGKTTILKRICDSTDDPDIHDDQGKKVDRAQIEESMGRGMHDIKNEMVFRSNPGFVFHDSRGFEAGSIKEFEQMKDFVTERAKTTHLKKRIHAIWYCISMDQYHRAVLSAEEKFFDECDTGNVPVVVVFTKCDALLAMAFGKLKPDERNLPREEQLMKVKEYAKGMLRNSTAWERLKARRYPPKGYVELENMHKSDNGCQILLERTATALNEEVMQMLLITTQHSNMLLCIKYSMERVLLPFVMDKWESQSSFSGKEQDKLCGGIALWFPHSQERFEVFREFVFEFANLDRAVIPSSQIPEASTSIPSNSGSRLQLPFGIDGWRKVLKAGIGCALILEHSFFLHWQRIQNPLATAAKQYKSSGVSAKVAKALLAFYPQYEPKEEDKMSELIMNLISEHIISKHVRASKSAPECLVG